MIARHLLALLLALPIALDAQVLPPDIRIEAAAAIGSRSLIVWGSTRLVADTIAPVLYWQMLDGAAPIGEPIPLADTTFAPTTYLQIIPFDRHFLILWNDRRHDSLTTWSTRIDTNGVTEAPALFADTAVRLQGIFRFDKPDGFTLLWNRWKDSATARIIGNDVSPDGELRGELIEIGEGWMSGIDTNVGAEGLRLIDRGSKLPLGVTPEGLIVVLNEASRWIFTSKCWFRDSTGSIWTLKSDNLARHYPLMTDSASDHLLTPSATIRANASLHLLSDSLSEQSLRFLNPLIRQYEVSGGAVMDLLYGLPLSDTAGSIPALISKAPVRWITNHRHYYDISKATIHVSRIRGDCYLLRHSFVFHINDHRHIQPDTSFEEDREIYCLSTGNTSVWLGQETGIKPQPIRSIFDNYCRAPRESGNIILTRASSTTDSRIVVTRDMVATTLTAPAILSTTDVARLDRPEGSMVASVIARYGVIEVTFIEPMSAPGRIEVWDLLGRRIVVSDIESGATRSMLTTGSVNVGAYIIRISHDGEIDDRVILLNE